LRSRTTEKWLNVVLDLNGILCVTKDIKSKGGYYNTVGETSKGHSTVVPTIVGKKRVYTRPNCLEFLSELGKIAIVLMWSSMMMFITDGVCKHLLEGNECPLSYSARTPAQN